MRCLEVLYQSFCPECDFSVVYFMEPYVAVHEHSKIHLNQPTYQEAKAFFLYEWNRVSLTLPLLCMGCRTIYRAIDYHGRYECTRRKRITKLMKASKRPHNSAEKIEWCLQNNCRRLLRFVRRMLCSQCGMIFRDKQVLLTLLSRRQEASFRFLAANPKFAHVLQCPPGIIRPPVGQPDPETPEQSVAKLGNYCRMLTAKDATRSDHDNFLVDKVTQRSLNGKVAYLKMRGTLLIVPAGGAAGGGGGASHNCARDKGDPPTDDNNDEGEYTDLGENTSDEEDDDDVDVPADAVDPQEEEADDSDDDDDYDAAGPTAEAADAADADGDSEDSSGSGDDGDVDDDDDDDDDLPIYVPQVEAPEHLPSDYAGAGTSGGQSKRKSARNSSSKRIEAGMDKQAILPTDVKRRRSK